MSKTNAQAALDAAVASYNGTSCQGNDGITLRLAKTFLDWLNENTE